MNPNCPSEMSMLDSGGLCLWCWWTGEAFWPVLPSPCRSWQDKGKLAVLASWDLKPLKRRNLRGNRVAPEGDSSTRVRFAQNSRPTLLFWAIRDPFLLYMRKDRVESDHPAAFSRCWLQVRSPYLPCQLFQSLPGTGKSMRNPKIRLFSQLFSGIEGKSLRHNAGTIGKGTKSRSTLIETNWWNFETQCCYFLRPNCGTCVWVSCKSYKLGFDTKDTSTSLGAEEESRQLLFTVADIAMVDHSPHLSVTVSPSNLAEHDGNIRSKQRHDGSAGSALTSINVLLGYQSTMYLKEMLKSGLLPMLARKSDKFGAAHIRGIRCIRCISGNATWIIDIDCDQKQPWWGSPVSPTFQWSWSLNFQRKKRQRLATVGNFHDLCVWADIYLACKTYFHFWMSWISRIIIMINYATLLNMSWHQPDPTWIYVVPCETLNCSPGKTQHGFGEVKRSSCSGRIFQSRTWQTGRQTEKNPETETK